MKTVNLKKIFKITPTFEIIDSLLKCFDLIDLNDTKPFTKYDLLNFDTSNKVIELIPQLILFYIPCKGKYYLEREITPRRAITVLNHFVSSTKIYYIQSRETIKNNKKIIYYKISHDILVSKLKIERNKLVSFD